MITAKIRKLKSRARRKVVYSTWAEFYADIQRLQKDHEIRVLMSSIPIPPPGVYDMTNVAFDCRAK